MCASKIDRLSTATFAACCAALLGVVGSLEGTSGPDLRLAGRDHDFGVAEQHQALKLSFALTNAGNEDLEILGLSGSCSCLVSVPTRRRIPPGEGGKIDVTLHTGAALGSQRRLIFLETNDPDEPEVELAISGSVRPRPLSTLPTLLDFNEIRQGAGSEESLEIWSSRGGPYSVKGVRTSASHVLIEIAEGPSGPENRYRLRVRFDADAPVGPTSAALTIETDCPEQPFIDVAVRGVVLPRVTSRPDTLLFKGVVRGVADSRLLRISTLPDVRVTQVESSTNFLSVRPFDALGSGLEKDYVVSVEVGPNAPLGRIEESVIVLTDDPRCPEIEIPVRGEVR